MIPRGFNLSSKNQSLFYFFETKARNKCFIVIKCTYLGLNKSIGKLVRQNPSLRQHNTNLRRHNKTRQSYIYMFPIAGQTAGPIGLKFFVDTQGRSGCDIG